MTKSCHFRQLLCDRCGSLWVTPGLGPRCTSSTAGVIRPSASLQETVFFIPVTYRSPAGSRQPALPYVCSAQRGNPSLWLLPRHLLPALTMLGGISCMHGGMLWLATCTDVTVKESYSSVPVSLIQRYCVLGKGVGANALPSPSFDHCVILFFYTNSV